MKKNVFISHASADIEAAKLICDILEDSNITCWFAPRDIPVSNSYNEEIINAIRNASIFVILLSEKSNLSDHVKRELDRASTYKLPFFAIRLQNIKPSSGIEYFLSLAQWIDFLHTKDKKPIFILADAIKSKLKELNVKPKNKNEISNIELTFQKEINIGEFNSNAIALSNDLKKIAVTSKAEFEVLDFETLSVLHKNLFGHAEWISTLAFSASESNQLVTVAKDRIVTWDIQEEEMRSILPRKVGSTYNGLRINKELRLLLEYTWHSDKNQYTQVFNIESDDTIAKFEGIKAVCGDFHPSNEFVICGFWDGQIKAYSIKEGIEMKVKFMTETKNVKHIRFSPCGNYFVTYAENWCDEDIKIWDCSNWKCIDRIKLRNKCNKVQEIVFDETSNQLLVFQNKIISFYNL